MRTRYRKTFESVIQATSTELDALAQVLSGKIGSKRLPEWQVRLRSMNGKATAETLTEIVEAKGVPEIRSADLFVGGYSDPLQVTVSLSRLGNSVAIEGDDEGQVADLVAIMKSRVRSLRPWWHVGRSRIATSLYAILGFAVVLTSSYYFKFEVPVWIAVIAGALVTVAMLFVVPGFVLGPRKGGWIVVRSVLSWLLLAVAAAMIAALVTPLVTPVPNRSEGRSVVVSEFPESAKVDVGASTIGVPGI